MMELGKLMELEGKKAFCISKASFELGKITEVQIVKETPKTFVIDRRGSQWVYRKSEMQTEYAMLAFTLFEALVASKMLMEHKVLQNNKEIKRLQKQNEELQEKIAEMEARLSGEAVYDD